jgi:hypothetical protein
MWRTHAPKIDAQTRASLEVLSKRARDANHASTALDELVRRLGARA